MQEQRLVGRSPQEVATFLLSSDKIDKVCCCLLLFLQTAITSTSRVRISLSYLISFNYLNLSFASFIPL